MTVRHLFCAGVVLLVIVDAGCTTQSMQGAPRETERPAGSATNRVGPVGQPSPFVIPDLADGESVKPGELALSGRVLVRVPEDQVLPITANWTEDNRLVLEVDGQKSRTIGVNVDWDYVDGEKVLVDPLAALSDQEIRGLWGIRLDHWSDVVAEKLKHVDPERVCITLTQEAAVPPGRRIPPLPDGIRYLKIRVTSSNEVFTDFSSLQSCRDLRFFAYGAAGRKPFDVSVLKEALQLEHLDLSGEALVNSATLARFRNLRRLDLRWCRELKDISFAGDLGRLEALAISHTKVADLTPLGGLERLEYVDADMSPVSQLPNPPLAALRTLRVLSTALSDESVAGFRRKNTACATFHRWDETLNGALVDATRLRIRSGGTCHRDIKNEKTLYETKDKATIKEMVDGIAIDEAESGFHCMCCGEPSLEFYQGEELILTLGFHHGQSLRWVGGWPGDGALTTDSAQFLVKWLAEHEVEGPQKQIEQQKEQQRATERRMTRAADGLPPALQAAFRGARQSSSGKSDFVKALRKKCPESVDQVGVLFALLGASNDSWTSLRWIEQLADGLLDTYDKDTLSRATETALRGTDRRRRRGAARYWKSWRSPLVDWEPEKTVELYRIVLTVQREARYYPTRQAGLKNLEKWREGLSAEGFTERLDAGLHDPHPSVRRKAMIVAGRSGHKPSVSHLMNVLKGQAVDVKPLPEVPSEESEDVPAGFDDVCGKRPEDEAAALALGYLEHKESQSVIAAKAKASPMFDVALALLGETDRLKPEYFRLDEDNTELQLAAVEAVIRCRGRVGLKWAIEYKQSRFWWEEEVVAERLSTMLRAEKAPGSDMLENCDDLKVVAEWFDRFGEQYLGSLRQ